MGGAGRGQELQVNATESHQNLLTLGMWVAPSAHNNDNLTFGVWIPWRVSGSRQIDVRTEHSSTFVVNVNFFKSHNNNYYSLFYIIASVQISIFYTMIFSMYFLQKWKWIQQAGTSTLGSGTLTITAHTRTAQAVPNYDNLCPKTMSFWCGSAT